jgi:hypothetical protein
MSSRRQLPAKAKEETMDFNMLSYGETYKGDDEQQFAPPLFNPLATATKPQNLLSSSQADEVASRLTPTPSRQQISNRRRRRKKAKEKKKEEKVACRSAGNRKAKAVCRTIR